MLSLAELLSNIQVVVLVHHSPGELICMVITNLMLHGSIMHPVEPPHCQLQSHRVVVTH